jgi:hypothetical protein
MDIDITLGIIDIRIEPGPGPGRAPGRDPHDPQNDGSATMTMTTMNMIERKQGLFLSLRLAGEARTLHRQLPTTTRPTRNLIHWRISSALCHARLATNTTDRHFRRAVEGSSGLTQVTSTPTLHKTTIRI